MIWRIIGTLGALSFIVTGFSVLTNPNCVSADIGGGSRVLRVTCRDDEFGGMSGTSAGFLIILIGAGLLVILYWGYIKRYVSGTPSKQIAFTEIISVPGTQNLKVDEIITETETDNSKIKFCDNCGAKVHIFYPKCFQCAGTTFTNSKDKETIKVKDPQSKNCPMCAEEIKFAAKKCRYCQHMLDA